MADFNSTIAAWQSFRSEVQLIGYVNQPPIANFTITPTTGDTNTSFVFSGVASSDPDGTIASYAWIFGDGTTGTGVSPSKIYSTPGTYTTTLTVTDNQGATGTVSNNVTVTAVATLAAHLTVNPTTGTMSTLFTFSGSTSTGNIVSYSWNFNDGTTASGVTVTKIFNAAGTFTVSLTVTDNLNNTNKVNLTVTTTGLTIGTGSRVKAINKTQVPVHSQGDSNSSILGYQSEGSLGTVVGVLTGGCWNVNFDSGIDGWIWAANLAAI